MWSVFKVFYTDLFIVGEGGTVDRSLVLLDAVSLTLSIVVEMLWFSFSCLTRKMDKSRCGFISFPHSGYFFIEARIIIKHKSQFHIVINIQTLCHAYRTFSVSGPFQLFQLIPYWSLPHTLCSFCPFETFQPCSYLRSFLFPPPGMLFLPISLRMLPCHCWGDSNTLHIH